MAIDLAALQARRAELLAAFPAKPAPQASSSTTTPPTEPAEPAEQAASSDAAKLATARALVQGHIARLTAYNEVKDVAQALAGMIAERRGVRVVRVLEELGMGEGD